MINKHVVIRTINAGVHVGTLVSIENTTVLLHDTRRIWSWQGAFSLSEVAQLGIDPKQSKMSVLIPEILLTQAIEVIPTTKAARDTFDKTKS